VAEQLSEEILRKIHEAAGLYHRLILVVGPPRSGKTQALQEVARASRLPLINVNLEVSRRLLDLTERQRVLQVSALLGDIVATRASDIVLLDNLEVLFDVSLQQDPLRMLQQLARTRTVVAAWNGRLQDGYLTYAVPDHPESRRYPALGLLVVGTGVSA
jgi:hypothetical protein